ncbi:hypothetical protein [Terriglobus sp. RCC_193]|uniref:hypothetical protein n=1 Tax=Terriglobus sp. RCC_193 TaxID=3239218 RepID=UPI003523EBB8
MATSTLSWLSGGQGKRPGILYPHAQWWFLLCIVLTWVGFGHSYFAQIRTQPLLHHVHGALMGGWILTLIVQPILYQQGRMKLHRTLGRWAVYLLVPAIVVCVFFMIRSMLRFTLIPPFMVDHLAFLDVASLFLFPLFVGLGIWYARNIQLHARYIACTVMLLMPPALARAGLMSAYLRTHFRLNVNLMVGLMSFVLLMLMVDDKRKGKLYAAYPVAFTANTIVCVCANFAQNWGWWNTLSGWIKG